jgi:hypothetical protein
MLEIVVRKIWTGDPGLVMLDKDSPREFVVLLVTSNIIEDNARSHTSIPTA